MPGSQFCGICAVPASVLSRQRHAGCSAPADHLQGARMETKMLKELLLQSLEHKMGGVKIYETALKCVVNEDLREEWEKYHQETEKHVQVLHDLCLQMQIDPEEQTPGRKITHDKGMALIAAMESALGTGDKEAAQCVACESVVIAELVDHTNW